MTVTHVPNGEEVALRAVVKGDDVDAIAAAEFTLYRITPEGEKVVGRVGGSITGRRARAVWVAEGLEPGESQASVYFRVVAGPLRVTAPEEIVVFHNRLEVTAVRDLDNTPEPGAVCRLRLAVDPSYRPPPDARDLLGEREHTLRANAQGVVVFDQLPPGRWEIDFRSPFELLRWIEPDGATRKALVRRRVRASFVYPDPASCPNRFHTQWVNLTENPAEVVDGHADHGPVLKVRARVSPEEGLGRAGDAIYLCAEFGKHNSDRHTPSPGFEDLSYVRGERTEVVEKRLTEDNGEVEFTVRLGLAGGDIVTLFLGGTPKCEDASLTVVNWRKVFIRPMCPPAYVLADNKLPRAIEDVLRSLLAPAFIEPEFESAQTFATLKAAYTVPPAIARRNGWEVADDETLVFYRHAPSRPIFLDVGVRYPPRLYVVMGHAFLEKTVELHEFSVTGPVSEWCPGKGSGQFVPAPFDGTTLLSPSGAAPSKVTVDGQDFELDDSRIEIENGRLRFRVVLPEEAARLVSKKKPGRVTLRIASFDSSAGQAIGNWLVAIALRPGIDFAMTIAHEIGHALKLAPDQGDHFPGLPPTHAYTYGREGTSDSEAHGGSGSHCAKGLSPKDRRVADYATVVRQGRRGSCIMFGTTGGSAPSTNLRFCDDCLLYLRAARAIEI